MRIRNRAHALALCTVVALAGCARQAQQAPAVTPAPEPANRPAQTPPRAGGPPVAAAADQEQQGGGRQGGQAATQPRPYNRVITAEARTRTGLFKTHRVGERVYFEIPRNEFGKDMLVMSRPASGGSGGGFVGGAGNRPISWDREGNRILLRSLSYDVSAEETAAIARNVAALRLGPIIASFNVEAWSPDSAAVIDVTRLFTTNIAEFAAVQGVQADRSFIENVSAFPDNVNVVYTQTGTAPPAAGGRGAPAPAPQGRGGGGGPQTQSTRMHWSMLKLPETPMRPRLHDTRIGIGSVTTVDYSRAEHRAETRRYIRRYRLEKRDPNAEVSDPIKPIVFWIDPATPEWLKPWVKKGVDVWRTAYEGAGFSNAIEGRFAPTNDPDFSLFDARHSVIYWRPSTTANATGGQVVDPRTGEILKAEVNMYHNVMNLVRNWYFTQVGPLDPRAQNLPLPDSLMGRLVEYVVTHEIGHAIGFPHNMKASAMYPADSVRSASFLRRMGSHVSTLMDYSRLNYVAQPEDRIPLDLLIPVIGPYDRFAIMWQNKVVPGARTPDEEKATLDQWARVQDTVPWLRFETADATADPAAQTEAVGDADSPKSSRLGLRNLQRVVNMLIPVAERPGQDYSLLEELYGNAIGQWGRYNNHVATSIGGADSQERYGTGPRFKPIPQDRQKEAMRYLEENAFTVPPWLINKDVLWRVQQEGVIARVRQAQAGTLNALLNTGRMNRLIEYEALAGPNDDVYTLPEMLTDLRRMVWSELNSSNVRIDVYRRNLQRTYVETVKTHLNPPTPPAGQQGGGGGGGGQGGAQATFPSDIRPALRGELRALEAAVRTALTRTTDAMTRLHLQDIIFEIGKILRPEVTA